MRAESLTVPIIVIALSGCSSSSSGAAPSDAGSDASSADGSVTDASSDTATSDGAPLPRGDWSCLGKVTIPAPTASTVKVTKFGNPGVATSQPLKDLVLKACALTDTACATPLDTQTADVNGEVSFAALPAGTRGFDGYFEATYPGDVSDLNFINPPFFADVPFYQRVYWSHASLSLVFNSGAFTIDDTRGIIGFEAHDCTQFPGGVACSPGSVGCKNKLGEGIEVSIDVVDPKIGRGYIRVADGGLRVDPNATATDSSGTGGFVNVPPGTVNVTWKLQATGQTVGTQKVFVRGGAFSAVILMPMP